MGRGPGEARLNVVAPPQVAPLYAAMKGVWNYKNTSSGRQAHTAAGQEVSVETVKAAGPRELSESLGLPKKPRTTAEAYMQGALGITANTPVLLPGVLLPLEGELPPAPPAAKAKRGGGGRKSKAQQQAAQPPPPPPPPPQ